MSTATAMTTAEKFDEYHSENPHVYDILVGLARQWRQRFPHSKTGIAALRERARWEIVFTSTDVDFKIPNAYSPFYARLIMWREPELDGIFVVASSQADAWLENLKTGHE